MKYASPEIYACACFTNMDAFSYFWSLNLDNFSPSFFSLYEANVWVLVIPFALSKEAVLDPIPSISVRYPFSFASLSQNFCQEQIVHFFSILSYFWYRSLQAFIQI